MSERQKILIVDDRRENLVALRQVLSCLDVDIVEAVTGNEALAASLDHDFAVAILDVQMPGMSGIELAEYLRGEQETRIIPIMFLTASYADDRHMFQGYEAGAVDYITKPFSPDVLLSKLRVFLEMDRNRRELEMYRDHLETLVAERTGKLNKRARESQCLYSVSSAVAEPRIPLSDALEAAVDLIPQGWQYPELAGARIVFEATVFASERFEETPWRLFADIVTSGKQTGALEVCYLEEPSGLDQGPFLEEEKLLIEAIAERLGEVIERKKAEEEILRLNAELEQRVEERTRELATANRDLEAFAYSVSHDLKAPVRGMDGFAELLADEYGSLLDEDGNHYLKLIRENSQRMGRLIEDLLAFSRLGRAALEREEVDTRKLVEQVIAETAMPAEDRNIRYDLGDLPKVSADSTLLRQVFVNLLSNAVKFTRDRDEALIEVGTYSEHDDQRVFFVRDNGVGFDMAYEQKLFGVFQRLHPSDDYEGTGVGLANVARIVKRHGGKVWAESAVGKGARFYFTIGKGEYVDG